MTNGWVDIKNADVILAMGGNPAENHPCGFKWTIEARKTRGAKLVVVDPRFTRTGAVADLYSPIRSGTDVAYLLGIIRYVRGRWRMKLAVRGAVRVLAIAVVLFFAAAYGMQWARFSGPSIIAARVLLAAALAVSVVWLIVKPLRRRVSDEQVALYLEEHDPSLQAAIISAVEAGRGQGGLGYSASLVRRLVQSAPGGAAGPVHRQRLDASALVVDGS